MLPAGDGDEALLAAQGGAPRLKLVGVDEGAPHVIGALAEFPSTVDNRVIRLVALQVWWCGEVW